jgi:hypothetical protein
MGGSAGEERIGGSAGGVSASEERIGVPACVTW